MAGRDPFSWAEQYSQNQQRQAAQARNDTQNALMAQFGVETGRQDPYFQLPVAMAKMQKQGEISLANSKARMDYAGSINKAEQRRMMMAPTQIVKTIEKAAQAYGGDPDVLLTFADLESGFDPNAKNPNSSAEGLFQFVDGTAGDYGLTNKRDPDASSMAAAALTRDNAAALRNAGIEPTPGALYLAHQQGAGGAIKLLSNPDAPVEAVLGPEAARLNGGRRGMTARQFASQWVDKADRIYAERKKARDARKSSGNDTAAMLAALDNVPTFKAPDGKQIQIVDSEDDPTSEE